MFSGQGSQYFQMGRALYDKSPSFAAWLHRMDELVADFSGQRVVPALYGDQSKATPFVDISLTHPAIFMVEYALARTLIDSGITPDYTLGASLGSFAAASISGAVPMETALTLVLKQAAELKARCEPGNMVAVLANPDIRAQATWKNHCEVAAVNFASHFVVSTPATHIGGIEQSLRSQSIVFQTLPVSFAFHSPWIDAARDGFQATVNSHPSGPAHTPLICCANAQVLNALPQDFFWNAVRAPIQFQQSIGELERTGSFRYLDLGPSGTLATFLKYILPTSSGSTAKAIITPYGREVQTMADITGRVLA